MGVFRVQIETMSLGQLGTNCYIIYNNQEAIIIDPGSEPDKVIHFIEQVNVKPLAILLTHAHFDHIGGVEAIRTHYHIDVYLHNEEAHWLEEPSLNGSTAFMREPVKTTLPEHELKPGKMKMSSFEFDVIHTPGHSPGSVSFIFPEYKFIMSGDVLFKQGVGRTDLPGGNMQVLENSIRNKLYQLDEVYTIYPGHGTFTTIGAEKLENPFVPATK